MEITSALSNFLSPQFETFLPSQLAALNLEALTSRT
jgi:hypothetical protein